MQEDYCRLLGVAWEPSAGILPLGNKQSEGFCLEGVTDVAAIFNYSTYGILSTLESLNA